MVPKGSLKWLEKLVGKEDVPYFGVWALRSFTLASPILETTGGRLRANEQLCRY
jgi:hypothetical protein